MRRLMTVFVALALLCPAAVFAQAPSVSLPRLIRISGIFRPADGQPPAAVETVTLTIYAEESDGTPLWQETQNVKLDGAGRYDLLLGATQADGIPLDVFASGEAQWLDVVFQRPGEVAGPRMQFTSVPYALLAGDAATLGGQPASAYMLAPASPGDGTGTAAEAAAVDNPPVENKALLPGTTNFLAKYVNSADVGSSAVFESAGRVGINTGGTTPLDILHVKFTDSAGAFTGLALQNLSGGANAYSGMLFYDQNGALGQFQGFNNTTHEYRINNIASGGSINFLIGGSSKFLVANSGNVTVAGNVTVNGNIGAKYQDVAEWVETSSPLEAGTVVVVDPTQPNRVLAAPKAYDTRVAGAVSRQPGVLLGDPGDNKAMVAQSGRVRVKADATHGAIRIGDLLVTSPTPGHAMRSRPMRVGAQSLHRPGTLLGKALEALPDGKGEILVLLTLQ